MKNLIFIAPPAAGKGTIAEMFEEEYGVPHISTGDLLRIARDGDNERSKIIAKMQDEGKLVPDDLVLELLKERLEQFDCKNGYILDGFPRNIAQAEKYEEILSDIDKELGIVIFIDLDHEIAKKRISGRLSCLNCGAVYNSSIEGSMPIRENICDNCDTTLIHRQDDNVATYEVRYQSYVNDTIPLIEYYREKNVLFSVDGNKSKEEILSEIKMIIDKNQ